MNKLSEKIKDIRLKNGMSQDQIRKRFDDELIELLEKFKWWDKSVDEFKINSCFN